MNLCFCLTLYSESREEMLFFCLHPQHSEDTPAKEKRVVRAYCLSCSVALWQVRSLLSGRCHGPTQQPSTIASQCSTQNMLPFQERSVCVCCGCVRVCVLQRRVCACVCVCVRFAVLFFAVATVHVLPITDRVSRRLRRPHVVPFRAGETM